MTPLLHERWPQLRATLPHVALGEPPTPVRRLAALPSGPGCDMWIKDDSSYGSLYGGNKVRKLEWILPDVAARADALGKSPVPAKVLHPWTL